MRSPRLKNSSRKSLLKLYAIPCIILVIVALSYFIVFLSSKKHGSNTKFSQELNYVRGFDGNQVHQEEITAKLPKIVHLDLKGAPPKITYYKSLFPLLRTMGATGILIEYEDMFPYKRNISALNAYSVDDIKIINKLAKENDLEIIPLIQTFGHLEFLLKLQEYKDLREVSEYPQVICPTHPQTLDLILEIIQEVVDLHPDSKYIHIGADEIYYLGFCDRCASTMSRFNLSKNMLFLEHVSGITSRIRQKYPRLKILMWDDQFRSLSLKELKSHKLDFIEPVVWKYSRDVEEELGPSLWDLYSQVFPRVWIATAFKGATGSNQYVCDVTHYVQNHRSWLSLISQHKFQINFQGVILTGWQRYDHFAVLCELLPVGLPSLAMSLRVLMGYKDSPLSPPTEVAKTLHCAQPYALISSVFGSPHCSFVGGEILGNVLTLQQLKQEFENLLEDSRAKGWLNEYNRKHLFSNPKYVESVTAPLSRIKGELDEIEVEISNALSEIYDEYTVSEWIETYIKPFRTEVDNLVDVRDKILDREVWPRRPLVDDKREL